MGSRWYRHLLWFYYFLHFDLSETIAFTRYLPITWALPVTSESCPLPKEYSNAFFGILLASFIYLHILELLLATWQFAIYGFCLQTQMTLLKSEMESMLNESLPVSTRIYRNLHIDSKVSPEWNCIVSFFLGLHCWKSWWSEHKTFHLSSSGNVSAEVAARHQATCFTPTKCASAASEPAGRTVSHFSC